jgi:hypothetical protein
MKADARQSCVTVAEQVAKKSRSNAERRSNGGMEANLGERSGQAVSGGVEEASREFSWRPEFMQCVRAGVHGYLPKDASAEDVVEGVRAVQAGEAVCWGSLCALLFHYFEREATSFPSASVRQRMGLTRREQQLIPLIAEGLTNKEIANRFCLSEQTVKNTSTG